MQGRRQRNRFVAVRHVRANRMGAGCARRIASSAATQSIVGGSTRVVDHVGSRVLVTRGVRFYYVPVEQRENLVEAGVAGEVSIVEV